MRRWLGANFTAGWGPAWEDGRAANLGISRLDAETEAWQPSQPVNSQLSTLNLSDPSSLACHARLLANAFGVALREWNEMGGATWPVQPRGSG